MLEPKIGDAVRWRYRVNGRTITSVGIVVGVLTDGRPTVGMMGGQTVAVNPSDIDTVVRVPQEPEAPDGMTEWSND